MQGLMPFNTAAKCSKEKYSGAGLVDWNSVVTKNYMLIYPIG